MEFSNKQKNQLEVSIGNIEMYVDKYKKFDWINCSDEELQDARSNVTRLLDLAKKQKRNSKRSKILLYINPFDQMYIIFCGA